MTDTTTQKGKTDTITRLQKYGKMGDSFDDAVNRVIDLLEKQK